MKGSLGHLNKVWKKNLKRAKKNKYYKKGYVAAKKGLHRTDNPYKLTGEILKLLRKRNMWERGWEDKAYSTSMNGALKKLKKENGKRKHRH